MSPARQRVEQYLDLAGITINGSHPWDIRVHNEKFYYRVLAEGSLGLGESYVEGWWDVEQLDEFFTRIFRARLEERVRTNLWTILDIAKAKLINLQSRTRAFIVGRRHYDLSNDLYKLMLDRRMVYSCGYWQGANNLDEAQEEKLELVCRKLGLQSGMRVLDIGCGWGSFVRYAAEKYDVEVRGITVSEEQHLLAQQACEGLPVEIKLQDYRDVQGQFDRVVSIGMFEHVGYKNYRTYLRVVREHLKPDGLFLLHTIGGNTTQYSIDPWIHRYIFPNGLIPSMQQVSRASEGVFVMEDWHNFGAHYDKTLMAWYENFERHRDSLRSMFNGQFFRTWKYYLLASAATFRARSNQLWQIVFSPSGVAGGYNSIRDLALRHSRRFDNRYRLRIPRHEQA